MRGVRWTKIVLLPLLGACGGGAANPSQDTSHAAMEGPVSAMHAGASSVQPTGGMMVTSSAPVAMASATPKAGGSGAMQPVAAMPLMGGAPAAGHAAADGGSSGAAGQDSAAGKGGAGAGGASAAGASAGAGGAGDAGHDAASDRSPLTTRKYPTTKEKVAEAPTFNITRPMDLKMPGGPLPVIAWANGGCFRSDFTWQPLFDRWAGAGFVVLALTGTGADDDLASMLSSTTDKEHAALLDWIVKANESGAYAGALDLGRIVLAGNSCGGVTALQVASKDKRAAAVFVLSGSSAVGSVDKSIMGAITIPVGYVTGNPREDVAAPNAADDYEALKDGIPAMLVQRTSGDHITVSTDAMVLPEDAEIALNWMDLALYGTKQANDTLNSPDVCEHCTKGMWKFKAKNLDKLVK